MKTLDDWNTYFSSLIPANHVQFYSKENLHCESKFYNYHVFRGKVKKERWAEENLKWEFAGHLRSTSSC